jgi:uncharacterized protein YkwD
MVLASHQKTSPSPHIKKRHGQHHKVSKHYSKTYWPYLPMLLIMALGFFINSVWSSPSPVLGYATSMSVTALLQDTNTQRIQGGLGALALNNQLSQAAQDKANDMVARDYWSHTAPDGKQPWQFMSAAGYSYTLAGENLAYGFAGSTDTVAGWMNSAGHRANILKAGYKDVGFGIANSPSYQGTGEETIVVAMYASPAAPKAAAPVAKAPVATLPAAPIVNPPAAEPAPAAPPVDAVPAAPEPAAPAPEATEKATDETQKLTSQPVSRIDVLTQGNTQWAALTLSVLVTLGAILLVYRHGKMWRRYLVEGEHFLIKHPLYDIAIVAAVVVCVLLSRTSGFIR